MAGDYLSRTAITTNFDKLLENAFADIGKSECQAIRMSDEVQFWLKESDKCYVLKLHGDYDTHNILNTEDETVTLDSEMVKKAQVQLSNAGLLVLGSAGREKSIHTFMDTLATDEAKAAGILGHGLLWAIYVGPGRPTRLNENDLAKLIDDKIENGAIGTDVIRLMKRRAKDQPIFAFFPIWGCGSFLWNLMHLILDEPSLLEAEQYLDHELRIGEVFRRRGLSDVAIQRHIKALMMANKKVRLLGNSSPPPDYVLEATTTDKITRVLLAYGDISDENLLRNSKQNDNLRAIVSPEDTCLSVGGGAALSIAHKAGLRRILHDLYKFAPISQGSTAVTSAGRLDVQYLIHAASVDVSESGASTNDAIVKKNDRGHPSTCCFIGR